jgi:hypothetical protein
MPLLVHLTPEKYLARIVRNGIRTGRGVYCMPVLPSYYVSHQWLRELKRAGQRTILAVYFRLPPEERVLVGHYSQPHEEVTVDDAVRAILEAPDARGYEIILPRRVEPGEIVRVRRPPQVVGWRFYPTAKGRPPCGCSYCARGQIKARKRRDAYEGGDRRPYPDILAEVRVLAGLIPHTPDGRTARDMIEHAGRSRAQLIVSRVYEIGGQGAAADLLCLLDDPDAAVAEAMAYTLRCYRGKTAREMLLRLCDHPADSVRELSAGSLLRMTKGGALPLLERFGTDPVIATAIADYLSDAET